VTLHARDGEPILLTIFISDKSPGSLDELRVEAARKAGFRDPERHGKYLSHQELHRIQNVDGFPLVGFHVDLSSFRDKPKYARRERVEIEAPSDSFMLWPYLSTPEFPIDSPDEPHVNTPLGDIYFRFK